MRYREIVSDSKEAWRKERKNGCGGSDLSSLLDLDEYSCKRQLAYDKQGIPPDYAERDKPAFRRGNRLEPVARQYYREKTKRTVLDPIPHAQYALLERDHARVSVDGVVYKEDGSMGVLEIKVLGEESYRRVRKEGIPPKWISQAMWGAGILGLSFTSFSIYHADSDSLITVDQDFDKETFDGLLRKVNEFWAKYIVGKELPERVRPEEFEEYPKRCKGCLWRKSCQGLGSDGQFLKKLAKSLEF